MHSYDNGTSLAVKRDNWNQLLKLFRKIGLAEQITENDTAEVLRCEENAAINFINKIYEILTHRKLQTTTKKPTMGKPAGYARETGSWKVRDVLKHSDDNSDLNTQSKLAAKVIHEHEKSLIEDRSLEVDRFSTNSIAGRSQQLPPSAFIEEQTNVPQVRVKEIQVKQLDRNVTHLRASKQIEPNASVNGGSTSPTSNRGGVRNIIPSGAGEGDSTGVSNAGGIGGYGANTSGGMLAENAVSMLNSCISRVIATKQFPKFNPHIDILQNFIASFDTVRNSNDESDIDLLISRGFIEIHSSAMYLADACIITPKQFWIVSDMFTSAISVCNYQSATYKAAINGFQSLGTYIARKDPRSSVSLFCDFALFKLAKSINEHIYKRHGILQVLYAFSPNDSTSHIQCIKKLQMVAVDLKVFVHCLTILCTLETKVDMSLLDLYLYYATIGLGLPSPRLRGGAVSMISTLYNQAGGMISPMLPQLTKLSQTETWWEIHGHMLSLSSSILTAYSVDIDDDGPETERDSDKPMSSADEGYALSMITSLFYPTAPQSIRLWGVSTMAQAVGYSDNIASLYLSILLSFSTEERRFLLGLHKNENGESTMKLSLPSSSGLDMVLEPVVNNWKPLCIARAIETKVIIDKLERLDNKLMEVLHGCVKSGSEQGIAQSLHKEGSISDAASDVIETTLHAKWVQIFNSMKDFILVGLCDPDCVEDASAIIAHFILKSSIQDTILLDNKFFGALRLLYPVDGSGHPGCQSTVEGLFRQIFYCGDYYSAAVISAMEVFSKNYSANYEMSNFPTLLREFTSK
jgi:hypothetical protein